MTDWRRVVQKAVPAVVAAACMLAPGVWAASVHHGKAAKHYVPKHYVAKHQLRRVPSRRVRGHAPVRKLNRKLPDRRAKPARRRYHPIAYRSRYRRRVFRRRFRMPPGPSMDRIEQIQRALSRSGYYQGDPTGRWDADTVSAMKNFQQAHGITPTGKIDAPSLQQLGLGSDVAGLAPPRPVITTDPPNSGKAGKGSGGR